MKKNKLFKVSCLGLFMVHMVIVNTGIFSPAIGQTGTGTGSGVVCTVSFQGHSKSVSDGSNSVHCVPCNWVTWELGTDGKYMKINNTASMNFNKQDCKAGREDDSCLSSIKTGHECPQDQPEPAPNTGTGE